MVLADVEVEVDAVRELVEDSVFVVLVGCTFLVVVAVVVARLDSDARVLVAGCAVD